MFAEFLKPIAWSFSTRDCTAKYNRQAQTNLLVAGLVLACLGLTACGGASTTPATSADSSGIIANQLQDSGTLQLTLTDAEGDFLAYTVDINSIVLSKADGTEVETVPLSTRIDFAEYTEVTEFFNVVTIPVGTYTSVTLNLDYSSADIVVQDLEGNSYQATAKNSEGEVITNLQVSVKLDNDRPIVVRKGTPAAMSVDFDLEASNTIESFGDPAIVTVDPFILVQAGLDEQRKHRARGTLVSVDVDSNSFVTELKPLYKRSGKFGEHTIYTNDATIFEINGTTTTGNDGLTLLNELPVDAPVITKGYTNQHQLTAELVLAGSSVPWIGNDAIKGVVVARNDNQLTVRGKHWDRGNKGIGFNDDVIVTISEETRLTRQSDSNNDLDIKSVSVGTRLVAFGALSENNEGQTSLDATTGHLRLMMNEIKGVVTSANPLTIDLLMINGRRAALFDFAGTGIDIDSDADANSYEIDVASLSLANLEPDDLVKIRGFVAPFGSAPEDFNARTVIEIDTDARAAVLNVHWKGASTTPFSSTAEDLLVLNLLDARYRLGLTGIPQNLVPELSQINIAPLLDEESAGRKGIYAIKTRGERGIKIYRNFANFVTGLNGELENGKSLDRILSDGRIDSDTETMHAINVNAVFHRSGKRNK